MSNDVLKTPDEWQATEEFSDMVIMDPDGWRNTDRQWTDPITREEFLERRAICTVRMRKPGEGQ